MLCELVANMCEEAVFCCFFQGQLHFFDFGTSTEMFDIFFNFAVFCKCLAFLLSIITRLFVTQLAFATLPLVKKKCEDTSLSRTKCVISKLFQNEHLKAHLSCRVDRTF